MMTKWSRMDCTREWGLGMDQKLSATFHLLAYGVRAAALEEKLGTSSTVAMESLMYFVDEINHLVGSECLCNPTDEDLKIIMSYNKSRGFLGMLGSIDCCK